MAALATTLAISEEEISIVLMYAAGQYTILDFLAGAKPADAAVAALLRHAADLSSSLFDGRVLGQLAGIKRLWPGGKVEVLVAAVKRRGAGFHKVCWIPSGALDRIRDAGSHKRWGDERATVRVKGGPGFRIACGCVRVVCEGRV